MAPVMSTSHRIAMDSGADPPTGRMTFKERLRLHFKSGKPKEARTQHFTRALFLFQATTQLYTTLSILVPYSFQDYDPWTRYYIKVAACYLCMNGVANWLCVMLYNTAYEKTRDRPEYDVTGISENNPDHFVARIETQAQNGTVPSAQTRSDYYLSWRYCTTCQMDVPPRTHHCDFCKKCILKRDHHCFMVGNCVGFKNQRYFIVLNFYSSIIGLWGGYLTGRYLYDNVLPHSTWTDFVLPVTFYRFVFADTDWTTFILVFHSYLLVPFGLLATMYFLTQMAIVAQGVTLYEISKNMKVRCTRPINDNFKSVFGDFWGFNFLFPAQIVFRQRDDGKSWDGLKIIQPPSPTKSPKHNC